MRFGNVAGSSGSVLRLFWEQIQKREPILVTDPRATRYFMSIPEAVHLILRAASLGKGGETFVLDMGEPMNIYELAKDMMLLAGLKPGRDLPIHFIGLKEGEKIEEDLWADWERPMRSEAERIFTITEQNPMGRRILGRVRKIEDLLLRDDHEGLLNYLKQIEPEFKGIGKETIVPTAVMPAVTISPFHSCECRVTIPLSRPDIGELEVEYVTRALRSPSLSQGPNVSEFEEKFANYVGTRYAIAVNSGTSALHLCVKALGIGPEDEAVTTSFSFVASSNCLLYEGALPVFADIDSDTFNIDPEKIREVITAEYVWDRAEGRLFHRDSGRALKAILPVHIFGLPCDMAAILKIADEFNLYVLEDACEALGSRYRGQHVGILETRRLLDSIPTSK